MSGREAGIARLAGTLAGHAIRTADETTARLKGSAASKAAALANLAEAHRRAAGLLDAEVVKALIGAPEIPGAGP